ncbi:hypothetical protein ACFL6H_02985 [Candidatus Latescibacterota bacterium]
MNYNFLIAGIMSIFLSFAHVIWGEKILFPVINKADINKVASAAVYISWYQISTTLLVAGIGLIILSYYEQFQNITLAAILITAIIVFNFTAFIVIIITKHRVVFAQTIPQTILFVIIIVLMILGIIK